MRTSHTEHPLKALNAHDAAHRHQVNHSPSFGADTALDVRVKTHALRGAIDSLRLSTAARRRVLDRQRRAQLRRLYGKNPVSVLRRKQVRANPVSP